MERALQAARCRVLAVVSGLNATVSHPQICLASTEAKWLAGSITTDGDGMIPKYNIPPFAWTIYMKDVLPNSLDL